MKKERVVRLAAAFIVLWGSVISAPAGFGQKPSASRAQEEPAIRAVLDDWDRALKARDREALARLFPAEDGVAYFGLDEKEKALDERSFRAVLEAQMKTTRIIDLSVKELKIEVEAASGFARYARVLDLGVASGGYLFSVPGVRETGVLKRQNGRWILVQQHSSAAIPEELWFYYHSRASRLADVPVRERRYRRTELQEDFDLFRVALEEAHAGLYQYTSRDEFDSRFDSAYEALPQEMTEIEFFRLLSPLVAGIRCNHTALAPSRPYREAMAAEGRFFPLALRILGGRFYAVGSCLEPPPLPRGSEILAVNGRPARDILERLARALPRDGDSPTYPLRIIERDFAEKYFLLEEQPAEFRLTFRPPGAAESNEISVPGIPLSSAEKLGPSFEEMYREALKFEILGPLQAGVMTVKTFVPSILASRGFDYGRFLAETFQKIREKGIRDLIIDLRGNDGGERSWEILTYLLPEAFQVDRTIDTPRTRYSFLEFTDKGLFFNKFHHLLWARDKDRYALKGKWAQTKEPREPRFDGEVIVLIDGLSISATSAFAALAHFHKRAVFVGEETGGAYWGGTSGDFINLTLPQTGLRLRIPIRRYVHAVSGSGRPTRGVLPDWPVEPGIDDVLNGRDKAMAFALDLVKRKRSLGS